jgi:hypothetical protein
MQQCLCFEIIRQPHHNSPTDGIAGQNLKKWILIDPGHTKYIVKIGDIFIYQETIYVMPALKPMLEMSSALEKWKQEELILKYLNKNMNINSVIKKFH